MRGRLRRAALGALAMVGLSGAAGASVVPGGHSSSPVSSHASATGDASAIAFYATVAAASHATDGQIEHFSASAPQDAIKLLGKGGFSLREAGPAKAGYHPVDDVVTIGARAGRIAFVVDVIHWAGDGPRFAPFAEMLTARGEVRLTGTASASTLPTARQHAVAGCAGRVGGAVGAFSRVGFAEGYLVGGHFLSMTSSGAHVKVTLDFPYSASQIATETDVISRASRLPLSSTIVVASSQVHGGFTEHWSNEWLHTPIYPPRTRGVCASIEAGLTGP